MDEKKNPGFKLDAKSVLNNPKIKKEVIMKARQEGKTTQFEKEYKAEPKKRCLKIEETKIGLTVVLSKGDCKQLGLNMEGTTKSGILIVREKLNLPYKQIKD